MSNSEFFRLYRELGKSSNIDARAKDISYDRERKEVLKAIGYDIKGIRKAVQPNLNHGKYARRIQNERHLAAISGDYLKHQYRKKKEFNDMLIETDKINSAAKELSELLAEKKPIPRLLLKQITGSHGSSAAPTLSSQSQSMDLKPHVVPDPILPRVFSKVRKSMSLNKWSPEERQRLNQLYNEIKPPPVSHKGMWELYYETIAYRFKDFFPRRSIDDIVTKVEELVTDRKLKEGGEKQFWQGLKDSKVNSPPRPPNVFI